MNCSWIKIYLSIYLNLLPTQPDGFQLQKVQDDKNLIKKRAVYQQSEFEWYSSRRGQGI